MAFIWTDTIERKLTKHYRSIWAKKLRKERAIYRKGLAEIINNKPVANYSFIVKEAISHYSSSSIEDAELEIPVSEFLTVLNNLEIGPYTTEPKITVLADTNRDVYYDDFCHSDLEASIAIMSDQYKFKSLKHVKRLIKGSILNWLHDAKWKLANQPNGKDAKRYQAIIDKT